MHRSDNQLWSFLGRIISPVVQASSEMVLALRFQMRGWSRYQEPDTVDRVLTVPL